MKFDVSKSIKDYYDKASIHKIRDFVFGNDRVDAAWKTIITYVDNPGNILEIGCGIGAMCNRLNLRWPNAIIKGIDISEKSIDVAKNLFESANCKFFTSLPEEFDNKKKFDLILLIDVIEHVEKSQRMELLSFIENNLSENGMLLLAFPTPYILDINRKFFPERLQPVEENVSIADLEKIAHVINKPLVLYKEIFVWERRDYAHAIFSDQLVENKEIKKPLREQLAKKVKSLYTKHKELDQTQLRKDIVLQKLNIDLSKKEK
jgi:2-polyprenyl-3-methyl-5-hydroxy-6-metoxy-1,4-benzoquinol methylase